MPTLPHAHIVSTIGDLIDGGYSMHLWCPRCQRGRKVDLNVLAQRYGRDATYIRPETPIRITCKDCGEKNLPCVIAPP